MTPKHVITTSFSEIKKIEITCNKCEAILSLPIPLDEGRKFPPDSYACVGCNTLLWDGLYDERYKSVLGITRQLVNWHMLKSPEFNLSFSLLSD